MLLAPSPRKMYAQQILNAIQTNDQFPVLARTLAIYLEITKLRINEAQPTADDMLDLSTKIDGIKRTFLNDLINFLKNSNGSDALVNLILELDDDDLSCLNETAVRVDNQKQLEGDIEKLSDFINSTKNNLISKIKTAETTLTKKYAELSWWETAKLRAKQAWKFVSGETVVGIWVGLTEWIARKLESVMPRNTKKSVVPVVKYGATFLAGTYIAVYGATSIATLALLSLGASKAKQFLEQEELDLQTGEIRKQTLGEWELPNLSHIKPTIIAFYSLALIAGAEVALLVTILPVSLYTLGLPRKKQLLPIPDKTDILRMATIGMALSTANPLALLLTVGNITANIAITDIVGAVLKRCNLSKESYGYGVFIASYLLLMLGRETINIQIYNSNVRRVAHCWASDKCTSEGDVSFDFKNDGLFTKINVFNVTQGLAHHQAMGFSCPKNPFARETAQEFFERTYPECNTADFIEFYDVEIEGSSEEFTVVCPPSINDPWDAMRASGCELTGRSTGVVRLFQVPVNKDDKGPVLGKPQFLHERLING